MRWPWSAPPAVDYEAVRAIVRSEVEFRAHLIERNLSESMRRQLDWDLSTEQIGVADPMNPPRLMTALLKLGLLGLLHRGDGVDGK